MPKRWLERTPSDPCSCSPLSDTAEPESVEALADRLEVSPLIVRLLNLRGVQGFDNLQQFLSPLLRHLAPPEQWPGMVESARVLADGLTAGHKFAVWGDYDVDGVTASAVVIDFLRRRGFDPLHHIPNRMTEGYGLNVPGIEALAEQGVELLLTVDCGITACESVARAKELGMTVVVSDHHLPGEELPPADAFCNPRLADCPCPDLAGVGVAFMLMATLNSMLPGEKADVRNLLDLVALGTLADVVKLQGQNRVLTKNGMLLINEGRRPGISALKAVSGYSVGAELGAGQITFGLAPRINAAGRMGHAEDALQLLLSPNMDEARPLAERLNELNAQRQEEEEMIQQEAMEQAEAQKNRLGLVLYAPHWHSGIIGIVASRVVEKYYRPTLILCEENGVLKGSGRSIHEFDLHGGLKRCEDLLLGYGGHRQAAGMSLSPENLEALRDRFHEVVREDVGPKPLEPSMKVDEELLLSGIDFTLLKELELLQPYGPGNPEPVFTSPPLSVRGRRVFGKDHVKLELRCADTGITLNGKAWRKAEELRPGIVGTRMAVAYTPKIDRYNGHASIDLLIRDWHFT